MEIVIHMSSEPKKIPSTASPSAVREPEGGMSRNANTTNIAIAR